MYFDCIPGYYQTQKIILCGEQNWRCCYCKFPVKFVFGDTDDQDAATREHLKPRAKGGSDDYMNVVIACLLCNVVRDHANPYTFEQTILKLLEVQEIKAAWHKFTPEQMRLLREEIEYGAILAAVETRGNSFNWLAYERKKKQRAKRVQCN